jgi:hypothetical protein
VPDFASLPLVPLRLAASTAWQQQQQAAHEAANLARAKAMHGNVNATGSNQHVDKARTVPPQVEAGLAAELPARDHAAESASKISAARAAAIGVSRASVERTEQIRRADPD